MAKVLELDNLSKAFEWRFFEIWGMREEGQCEEAETAAAQLLMEPRLSSIHRAGLHLLLARSPNDYVDHAKEAVRLYKQVIDDNDFSPSERANVEKMLSAAEKALHEASHNQATINREVQKELLSDSNKSMEDLHNARTQELFDWERRVRAPVGSENEDTPSSQENTAGDSLSPNNKTVRIVLPSNQSVPETAVGDSQCTNIGRSQSTALTDLDDATTRLPDFDKFHSSGEEL